MSKSVSKLWFLGPPVSLLLVAAALYVKQPWARDMVDIHCPWVKSSIGKYAPPFDVVFLGAPDTPTIEASKPAPLPSSQSVPANAAPLVKLFDLQKVFADSTLWPKSVVLKKSAGVGDLKAQRFAYSRKALSNNSRPTIVSLKIFKPVATFE